MPHKRAGDHSVTIVILVPVLLWLLVEACVRPAWHPASRAPNTMARPGRGLKFCPETNDLLYPRENKEFHKLEYYCKNCDYVAEADPRDWRVYVSETTFSSKDKTVIVHDVIADPTLPRTKDVTCPVCQHNEAVFISESTEKGMTLFFNCVSCKHRWKDYI